MADLSTEELSFSPGSTATTPEAKSSFAVSRTGQRLIPWVVALLILGGGLGAARVQFGSIALAVRYARGERLILEPASIRTGSLATDRPKVVSATIHNFGAKPIRVLGSAVNCVCVTVQDLPDAIPSWGSAQISLAVRALPGKAEVKQNVVIFTDHEQQSRLPIRVEGSMALSVNSRRSPSR